MFHILAYLILTTPPLPPPGKYKWGSILPESQSGTETSLPSQPLYLTAITVSIPHMCCAFHWAFLLQFWRHELFWGWVEMPSMQKIFFSLLHIPTIYLCYMFRGKEWKGKRDSWARQKCLVRAELKGAFPLKQVCVTLQAGQHPIASSRILPEPTGLPAFKVFPGLYFIVDHQYSHSSPSLENKQKFILMGEI